MRGRKSEKQKRTTRRISAAMFALALAASLILSTLLRAVSAQAETEGCEITLTPSEPAVDNQTAGVYGYYNADSEVSVDILVQAEGKDTGIRWIEYWITDGAEETDSGVLYKDLYVAEEKAVEEKEAEAPEETGEPSAAEEEEPREPHGSKEVEEPKEPEEPETPNEPGEPETPKEPEEPEDSAEEEEDDGEAKDAEHSDQTEDSEEDDEENDEEEDEKDDEEEGEKDDEEKGEKDDEEEGEKDDEDSSAEKESESFDEEENRDERSDEEENGETKDGSEESGETEDGSEEPGETEGEDEADEPDESGEPDEAEGSDEPEEPDEPEDAEEPEKPDESEEPEVPKESEESEASKEVNGQVLLEEPKEPVWEGEAHQFLESWEGSVVVDTARYHTGEVRIRVKAMDSAGCEREEEVRLDIDIVAPEVQIAGVSDQHAYRGNVAPKVQIHDANFSAYEISLTRTRMDEVDVDVTERFFPDRQLSGEGGDLLCETIERTRENDGIYTLCAKATDYAGNASEATATFSVNRFGSVYVFSDYLLSLIQNGGAYAPEIEQDLVITEYNANRLMPGSLLIDITRDARPVTEVISDLTPAVSDTVSTGASGWYEYQYTIDRANFASDGIYKISLSSEDEAGNTPDNVEATGMELLFRVDGTEPEITGNAKTDENGGLAEGENFVYTIYDTMGLDSVEVYVDGDRYDDAITEFGEDGNNYSGTLSLPTVAAEQEVRLVATDRAGNIADTSFAAPGRVRTLQDVFASPAAALKQLAKEGVVLPVLVGAAVAAAAIFTVFRLRAWRMKRER